MARVLHWFRKGLRLHDNPALVEALKEAPDRGWTVVSMKDDWKVIFTPE